MQKIRNFYRAVFRENIVRQRDRQRERQTDRDGPEFKGPPDAIAKPSDQKTSKPDHNGSQVKYSPSSAVNLLCIPVLFSYLRLRICEDANVTQRRVKILFNQIII